MQSLGWRLLIVRSANRAEPQGTLASCSLPDQCPRKERFKFVSQGILFLECNDSNYTHFSLPLYYEDENFGD